MKRELTCIVCPMGCRLSAELEEGRVVLVSGFTCARGKQYAMDECTHPVRTLTTTARCEGGLVLPVKTDRPIPKEKMTDCMQEINRLLLTAPVHIGDVLIRGVADTDANVIATANLI